MSLPREAVDVGSHGKDHCDEGEARHEGAGLTDSDLNYWVWEPIDGSLAAYGVVVYPAPQLVDGFSSGCFIKLRGSCGSGFEFEDEIDVVRNVGRLIGQCYNLG